MSFFSRLFKAGEAAANAALNDIEDPVQMTEQGIRDLKEQLQKAIVSFAEIAALSYSAEKEVKTKTDIVASYEDKAIKLLSSGQRGLITIEQADKLAEQVLIKKQEIQQQAVEAQKQAAFHIEMKNKLSATIEFLKDKINEYERELSSLKARAATAAASRKINEQLSKIDPSGTIAVIERMKQKVESEENLAQAYFEMSTISNTSVDSEIDAALSEASTPVISELEQLKHKIGLSLKSSL